MTETQTDLAEKQKAYAKKVRNFVKLILDTPTAMWNCGYVFDQQFGGLCGSLASCISLYEIIPESKTSWKIFNVRDKK